MSCESHQEEYRNLLDSSLQVTYLDNQNIEIKLKNTKTNTKIKWIWGSFKHFVEEFVYFYNTICNISGKSTTFFTKITKNYLSFFKKEIPTEKLLSLFLTNIQLFFNELKVDRLNFNNFIAFLMKNYSRESVFIEQSEYNKIRLNNLINKKYQIYFRRAGLIPINFKNILFNVCTDKKEYDREYFISNREILELLNQYMGGGTDEKVPIDFTSQLIRFKDEKDTFFFELQKKFGIEDSSSSNNLLKFLVALDRYFNNIQDKEQKIQYNSFIEFLFSQTENFIPEVNDGEKKKELEEILLIPKTEILKRPSTGQPSPHLQNLLDGQIKKCNREQMQLELRLNKMKRELQQSKQEKIQSIRNAMRTVLEIKSIEIQTEFDRLEEEKINEVENVATSIDEINVHLENLEQLIVAQTTNLQEVNTLGQNLEGESERLGLEINELNENGIILIRELETRIQLIEAERNAFDENKQRRIQQLGVEQQQQEGLLNTVNQSLGNEKRSLLTVQQEIERGINEIKLDTYPPRIGEIQQKISTLTQITSELRPLEEVINQQGIAVIQRLQQLNGQLDAEIQRIAVEERLRKEEEERRLREEEERRRKEEEERINRIRTEIQNLEGSRAQEIVDAESLKNEIGLGSINLSEQINQLGSGLVNWKKLLEERIELKEREDELRRNILDDTSRLPLDIDQLEIDTRTLLLVIQKRKDEIEEQKRQEAIQQEELRQQRIAEELKAIRLKKEALQQQIEAQRKLILQQEGYNLQIGSTIQSKTDELNELRVRKEGNIKRYNQENRTFIESKNKWEQEVSLFIQSRSSLLNAIKELELLERQKPKMDEMERSTDELSENIQTLLKETHQLKTDVLESIRRDLQVKLAEKGLAIEEKSSEIQTSLNSISGSILLMNQRLKQIEDWIQLEGQRGPMEESIESQSNQLGIDVNALFGETKLFKEELENELKRIQQELENRKRREEASQRQWTEAQRKKIQELEQELSKLRQEEKNRNAEETALKDANLQYERDISESLLESRGKLESFEENIEEVSRKLSELKGISEQLPGLEKIIGENSDIVIRQLSTLDKSIDTELELIPLLESEGKLKEGIQNESRELNKNIGEFTELLLRLKTLLGDKVQLMSEADNKKREIVEESRLINEGIHELMRESLQFKESMNETIERNQMARSNFNSRKSRELNKLESQLNELNPFLSSLESQILEKQSENASLSQFIGESLPSVGSSLESIHGKVQQVKGYMKTINKQRDELSRLEPTILENSRRVIDELTRLNKQIDIAILEEKLREARAIKDELESQRINLETILEGKTEELGIQIKGLRKFLEDYKQKLEYLQQLRGNLSTMESRIESETDNLQGDIQRLGLEGEKLKTSLLGKMEEERIRQSQMAELERRKAILRTSIETERQKIASQQQIIESLRSEKEGKESELSQLRGKNLQERERDGDLRRVVDEGRRRLEEESERWREEFKKVKNLYQELNQQSGMEEGLRESIRQGSEVLREGMDELSRQTLLLRDELLSEFRRKVEEKELSLQTQLSTLRRGLQTNSQSVEKLSTFMTDLQREHEEENRLRTELRGETSTLQSSIEGLNTETTLLRDQLSALQRGKVQEAQRLESIRSQLQPLENQLRKVENALTPQMLLSDRLRGEIAEGINGVSGRLSGIEGQMIRIQKDLIEGPRQLRGLEREIETNAETVITQLRSLDRQLDEEIRRISPPPPPTPVVLPPARSLLTPMIQEQQQRIDRANRILSKISTLLNREVAYKGDLNNITERDLVKLKLIHDNLNRKYQERLLDFEEKMLIPKTHKYLETIRRTKLYKNMIGNQNVRRLSDNELLNIYRSLDPSIQNVISFMKVPQDELELIDLKEKLVGNLTRANKNSNIEILNTEGLPNASYSSPIHIHESYVPNPRNNPLVPYQRPRQTRQFSPILGSSLPIQIPSGPISQPGERVENVNEVETPIPSDGSETLNPLEAFLPPSIQRSLQVPERLRGARDVRVVVPPQTTPTVEPLSPSKPKGFFSELFENNEGRGSRKGWRGGKKEKKITIRKKQLKGKRMK